MAELVGMEAFSLSYLIGSYGLFIGVVCLMSLLWLIPFGIKYFKDGAAYSVFCTRFNITEHGFGYITFEWSGFTRYLPKQFLSTSVMNLFFNQFFKTSFMIGVYLSLIMLVICAAFLVFHLFYFVFGLISLLSPTTTNTAVQEDVNASAKMDMVMLIPGVNIPLNQVSLLILSLILCLVVHEYGHAIAADYHDVKVESFGFAIFYCLPSAFVAIETETLERKPLFVRLMVYCGGVWHNIILCFIIGIGLFLFFNPSSFLSIIERPENGVFVKYVHPENPLYEDLHYYDNIVSINSIPLSKVDNFMDVIQQLKSHRGFLVTHPHIDDQKQKFKNKCCLNENDDDNYSLLCFKGLEDVCVNVRQTTIFPVCSENGSDSPDKTCIVPHSDTSIHILRVSVLGKKDMLYMGTLEQFFSQVIVSDVKVIGVLSYVMSLNMAFYTQKLFEYTAALSLGLAVFNLAPVEFLDGAKIYETLFIYYIQYFTTSKEEIEKIRALYRRILSIFKVILILNIVAAFINAFKIAI